MAAHQNQINLEKEYYILLQGMVNWHLFFIISRSIWYNCPISSCISNTILLNVCGGCQETSALWLFALRDIVLYRKRHQISTSAQFSCYRVKFRFKFFLKFHCSSKQEQLRNLTTNFQLFTHVHSQQFVTDISQLELISYSWGGKH